MRGIVLRIERRPDYDPKTEGPWPGEVGPFFIDGAAPGDTLVVRILKLTPNRDVAIPNEKFGFGARSTAGFIDLCVKHDNR